MKNTRTLNSAFPVQPERVPKARAVVTSVKTGQSEERLRLFAGIHKSKKFSLDAAHQLFVGTRK